MATGKVRNQMKNPRKFIFMDEKKNGPDSS